MSSDHLSAKRPVWGSVLLVAGCCIGAGMLGLPLVTIQAGFWPSLVAFMLSWAYMAATGLLLLEANLGFGQGIHLMTLAEKTLGSSAKAGVAVLFTFLFYCLMVAYISGGGILIRDLLAHYLMWNIHPHLGSVAVVLLFGLIVFLGAIAVDKVNRWLMLGLGISYAGLVFMALPHVEINHLIAADWMPVLPAIPTMIISFGYHNLIPTLTNYLGSNVRQLRIAILGGSLIPLILYIIWNGIILGLLPASANLNEAIQGGAMVTTLLQEKVGAAYVVELLQLFAFLALATSFLAVALSFVDFLADGLKIEKTIAGSLGLIALVLLPPLLCTYLYPGIFLKALNYAGAFGTVILFGIFPVAMVWKGRYYTRQFKHPQLGGGKLSLLFLAFFAVFIFLMQLKIEFF